MFKVLLVDDDSFFCTMLKTFLTKKEYEVKEAFSFYEGMKMIKQEAFDVIITDFRLPDKDGIELLKEIKIIAPQTIVILMTGYADIKMAVKAVKMGAFEYIAKPINPDEILITIKNALNKTHQKDIDKATPDEVIKGFNYIKGISDKAVKINEYIDLVSPTNMSVIIQGESGTGKEFVARKIHSQSKRKNNSFVAIDCGALSRDLAGSEFFGHLKGAFTGAVVEKIGQFEAAKGGTLFLDEIGNLSYDVQVKLLRAIQEKKIKKIGSNKDVDVDARIITASNEDLVEAVKNGGFREDLYHRINEFTIHVAPLREMQKDIKLFAGHFLDLANKELGKEIKKFDLQVMDVFLSYSWPGNLRELKNVIMRAVLLAKSEIITTECLPVEMVSPVNGSDGESGLIHSSKLKSYTERTERDVILNTLERTGFNKSKAARILNIDRKTLYAKIKLYNIPD